MSSGERNFGEAKNQDRGTDAQDSKEEPMENGLPIDTKSQQDPLRAPIAISREFIPPLLQQCAYGHIAEVAMWVSSSCYDSENFP